jgi:hypothetical protein
MHENEVPRCEWCEEPADEALGGFTIEPEDESLAPVYFCSMECLISAS